MRIAYLAALTAALASAGERQMPMPVDYGDSASYRWLQKQPIESRLLDGMEDLTNWQLTGQGEISLTGERAKDGKHAVRLAFRTRTPEEQSPQSKRNYGIAGVMRRFPGEDWSAWNRVSLWVRPDFPGWRVAIVRVSLRNEGKVKVPGGFYPVYHCAVLKNHVWNHVVWEIPDIPRDRVTGIEIQSRRQGNEPEASDRLSFDVDRLELEKVEADHYEGWDVAKGRLAFSHTGYLPDSPKIAIASDLAAQEFQIVRRDGQTVLTKPLRTVKTPIGQFRVLDFSELREPGTYAIRAGQAETRPFRIAPDVWKETVWKAINFFYAERCGADIPGSHRLCHRDWQGVHGDKRIVINGGWHDAGDLSQGLVNTSEAVYAMFDLAEHLDPQQDADLRRRLLEEAKWGLEWVLKTSFGDGYRVTWATMGMWTDGILGNNDDVTSEAQNSPYENFLAAASEAIAARVLRQSEPDVAAYSLRKAQEDWQFAVAGMEKFSRGALIEAASAGILASLELFSATREQRFAEEALRLAPVVTASQQRELLAGVEQPVAGYFFTSPKKDRPMYYLHRGHEQGPVVALARLCSAFPEHPDWMKWYSGVVLHSEFYQKAMARFTEPYRMLPNSVHKGDEYLKAPEAQRENVRQQVLNGFKLGGDYYVRAYPVQPQGTFRGNYGTMLSQAKAVSVAARLRRSSDLQELAQAQLHWVVGANPFAQSTMYGEGYDYQPQYSAMSGDIVGSLPVGIKSRENFDLPYWPVHNYPNYKEVWVHPVSRWIWLMSDLMRQTQPAPASGLTFTLSQQTGGDGQVTIRLSAKGAGKHRFALRTENLQLAALAKELDLSTQRSGTLVWSGKVASRSTPWVAVAVADENVEQRAETFGAWK